MGSNKTILLFISSLIYLFVRLDATMLDESTFPEKRKKKPDVIPQINYCRACISIILASLKELHGKKSETDIEIALMDIFDKKNVIDYFQKPLIRTAKIFHSVWEEELIFILRTRRNDDDKPLVDLLCFSMSNACTNVKKEEI